MSDTEQLQHQINALEATVKTLQAEAKAAIQRESDLRLVNERLEKLDREKSEFVSVAAHQMRTPLSAIKWSQQMLLDGELGPLSDEQKDIVKQTSKSINRLIRLVKNLLDANYLEAGYGQTDIANVDVVTLIKEVVADFKQVAAEKQVELVLLVNKDIPPILASAERIKDVFYNLIDNAIKYTPASGKVTVQITSINGVTVIVRDTGIGIPVSYHDKIFSRFARADNAKRVDADGSGLGLYIAKKIVEHNNGSITCDSTEGVGTTFTVSLPNIVVSST